MKRSEPYELNYRGKVYTRTFCALLAMSVIIVSAFYISLNRMVIRHHREQLATTNLDYLRLSASSLDVTFEVLAQTMTQTLWNPDFIQYMINPADAGQAAFYRVSARLRQDVANNSLIRAAYFYSPLSDVVFRNGNPVMEKSALPDWDVIEAYEASEARGERNAARTTTTVFLYDGRLFLFQKLDIAAEIGTLAYELDQRAVRDELLGYSGSDEPVLVFDAAHSPLFPPSDASPAAVDWRDEAHMLTPENAEERFSGVTRGWYVYRNALGWYFLLPLSPDSLGISFGQVLGHYLPFFLCLLAVCLAFSLYIARVLYQPISRLMRLVLPANDASGASRSETDILETAYHTALAEQSQLRGIVSNIAPEILESMLKNLLVGKRLTQERVGEILHGVGDPLSVDGQYVVLACRLTLDGNDPLDETEFNLYLLTVRGLIQQLTDVSCAVYDIHSDLMTVALICSFPPDTPVSRVAQDVKGILQTLRLNAEALPFRLFCARGKVYRNLLDIRYSYRDAMERVQYQEYLYCTGEPSADSESADEAALATDHARIKARAAEIMDLAARDEQAEALLRRTLDEIDRQAEDDARFRGALQMLRDEMLDRVIAYPLTEEDQYLLSRRSFPVETEDGYSRAAHSRLLCEDAHDMFRMVSAYGQKNRYRYIEQAKQYITENYMDSNLSLGSVGDHVGISASYLSELWSEVTHEKFSAYLAAFRVEKAQQLLRTTTLTVKEIGFRCGFNSAQNFIRVYKKYAGISPGQLRERLQHPEKA